jgi:hypothetical protein
VGGANRLVESVFFETMAGFGLWPQQTRKDNTSA